MDTNLTCEPEYQVKSWPDMVNLLLGIFFCVTPWFALESGTASTWNAVLLGAAIAIAAIFAIVKPCVGTEWTNVGLGLWLLVAPWVLDLSRTTSSVCASVLTGIFVTYFASAQLILLKRSAAMRGHFHPL